jgi:hypothetical protein
MLQLHCRHSSNCATCSELSNHFTLWQTIMSALQACALLTQSYNPHARTFHWYLMGCLLHALQARGAALVMLCFGRYVCMPRWRSW